MLWGANIEIVDKIIDCEADYVLAVKENQKQLYQDIQDEFRLEITYKHTCQKNWIMVA